MHRKFNKTHINKKLFFLIAIAFNLLLIGIIIAFFYNDKPRTSNAECDHVRFANAPISPKSVISDKNDIHLFHATKNGLKQPFKDSADFDARIDDLKRKSILVEVNENRFYQIKSLTYSLPYLIPEAVDLLNEIGYRFQTKLKEKKYNNYRFRITSLLRTEETQNKLSNRNHNATGHSAHLYGTTFDISYKNFHNTQADSIESSYEAVQTLTKVLVEMREECKFLAVRERKQSCFHITVVVCRPIE